ncbi:MAG: S-layer homology domain-containing protein [Firmicutes bacterium]|nr:S-layer homology domain-containing protein [Bacillota bacterium]
MAGVRWAGKRFMGLLLAGILLLAGGYPALAASPDLHFQLYFVFSAPRDFYLVPVDVSVPDPTGEISASPSRQVAKVLELLIQGPPAGSPLWCSLPKETRVLGCQIRQGTAEVDLSQEVLRCNVGARTESLLLASIVATAGQVPGVERVSLLVEGRPVPSLGGHIDASGPFRVEGALEHALFEGPADLRGHWSEGPATALFLAGVLHGYPEGDFRPERPVSRAELFKMLVVATGLEPQRADRATFADVPVGHWAHPYVERAVSAGILVPSDYGPRLGGDGYITRREVAVALVRARGLEGDAKRLRGSRLPYTDTDSQPDWARGYLAVAHREGLMVGDPVGTFRPASPLKRGEAAAVVARLARLGGPSIYLAFPPEGARAGEWVLALGVARVFEATVQGRLRVDGKEVASTYATATRGAPEWGVFAFLLPCPKDPPGDAVLEVFWQSPEDGSEQDLVSRRLPSPLPH